MGDDRNRRRGARDDRGRRPRRSRRDHDEYEDEYEDDYEDEYEDRRPRRRGRDDYEDDYEDDFDEGAARRSSRRRPAAPRRRAAARRPAPRKRGFLAGLFGGGSPPPSRRGKRGRIDFGAVDDDYEDDYEERRPRAARRGRRAEPPRKRRRRRERAPTLPEMCTPIFGYATVLPHDDADPHPDYLTFRQGVVSALQRLESDAKEYDIEVQDARECAYALALFMDEQVLTSKWNARDQWAGEPLNIVLNQDPEGGVNFFRHLEGLRDGQTAVKEVYLLCLALGFRGRYATEELRVQTKKIGELKMKILKDIESTSMDSAERLFPEAYEQAAAIEDEVEPAPRWWWWASAGAVVGAVLLWLLLFWLAGSGPREATDAVRELASNLTGVATAGRGGA